MRFNLRTALVIVALLSSFACGKNEGDKKGEREGAGGEGSPEGSFYGKVILTSSALGLHASADADCGFSMDIYRGEGYCMTPLKMNGWAEAVNFYTDKSGRGPTRILSESEDSQGEGEIIAGSPFDFADIDSSALTGNNTLFEEYEIQETYKGIGVKLPYLRAQILLKDKYVSILLPTYSQPFASAAQELCGFNADTAAQDRYTDADLLEGMTFSRGDFLFCVKDTADEACAAADFKWFDTATDTLVTSRPTNPKQSVYLAENPIVCTNEGDGRYDFNFGDFAMFASIPESQGFTLYGDFSFGSLSQQWPGASSPKNDPSLAGEDPYLIYYYKSADGEEQEGTNLVVEIDFDPTHFIFLEAVRSGDVAGSPLEFLLDKLQFKTQWAFDQKHQDGVVGGFSSHYAGMSATARVTLSGGSNPPKAENEL